jgi:aspartyl protease family protein
MLSSMSLKSLSIAVAALGFTGITPPDGGARMAAMPGTVRTATAPATASPVDLAAGGRSLTLAKAADGLFYVTAHVNDVPVRFVVDTGANVVVLTGADARAIGLKPAARTGRQTLRTAGGRRAMRWASIDRLKIAGQTVENTEAVVIAADGPPHSLLGQSALARFESVTLRGDRLELKI